MKIDTSGICNSEAGHSAPDLRTPKPSLREPLVRGDGEQVPVTALHTATQSKRHRLGSVGNESPGSDQGEGCFANPDPAHDVFSRPQALLNYNGVPCLFQKLFCH